MLNTVRTSILARVSEESMELMQAIVELTSPASSEQSRKDCETICKLGLKVSWLNVNGKLEDGQLTRCHDRPRS